MYGQKEGRSFDKLINISSEEFDWKQYIANYVDLQECGINTFDKAFNHWKNNGQREGRQYKNIFEDGFLKYEHFELSHVNNNIFFKPKYENYGLHYCGWEKIINEFIYQYKEKEFKCKLTHDVFFDEWFEKLLIWGNKLINDKFIYKIKEKNLKVISFIHNPYFSENLKNKKGILITDDSQFNQNLFRLIQKENLSNNIEYLYCLSLQHKEILCNKFPHFQNKFVSVYHPIFNNSSNKQFSFDLFLSNKSICHIGWWLRNFDTFINFNTPPSYSKKILIKNDFKQAFFKNFSIPKNKQIEFKYQLSNDKYQEIFISSVIFVDIVDGVANNTILECIIFNTPIIIRRTASAEEYLGKEYPLFFESTEDIFLLYEEPILLNLIQESHKYLQNMDKTHVCMEIFNKKLNYDIGKLNKFECEKTLTWLLFVSNHTIYNLESFITEFLRQDNICEICLDIVYNPSGDDKYLRELRLVMQKYKDLYYLRWIEIDLNKTDDELMSNVFDNCLTEFMTLVEINDTFETHYSKTHITFLKENPSCDISTSSYYIINENNDLLLESLTLNQHFIFLIHETLSNNNRFVWRTSISNYITINNIPVKDFSLPFFEFLVQNHLNLVCSSNEALYTINLNN